MADANVSQLEINGTTYDICDATARDSLSSLNDWKDKWFPIARVANVPFLSGRNATQLFTPENDNGQTIYLWNFTTAGNIRLDKSTDSGATYNTLGYYYNSYSGVNPTTAVQDTNAWRTALGFESSVREINGTAVSVPTGGSGSTAGTNLLSISVPQGIWLFCGGAIYAANSTGLRYLHITKTSKGSNNERVAATIQNASASGSSLLSVSCILNFNQTTTVYLVGWQTSGAALSTSGYLQAFKLA